jgi:hypothetical protein
MAGWLGNYLFGKPLQVTSNITELAQYDHIINYSPAALPNASYHIAPCGLLFEDGIKAQDITIGYHGDFPYFFAGNGQLNFDLLSGVFYLISRYEEYLPHQKDEYGRYAHTNSVAFRNNFLNRPLVDEWMTAFKTELKTVFPYLVFAERSFCFVPTYDVDIAWSYRNKEWVRITGGFFKDLVNGKWRNAAARVGVLSGKKTDPFDVFDELDLLHKKYGLHPHYFILLAQQIKGYDKNISPFSKAFRSLIKDVYGQYSTGIHLSWQSAKGQHIKQQEIDLLTAITGEKPIANRMHYINFNLPQTFQSLLSIGITKEYSMGYGSINGFRASVCTPFYWYDLSKEEETALEIFPYCYMEANAIFEQKDEPDIALKELQHYHDNIKQHGGMLITIFHNHLIGLNNEGRIWMQMYKQFLERNFE